jgi:hypothetical protein
MSAAQAAAAAWSRGASSCTNFEFQIVASDAPDAPTANDKQNNLVFRKADWQYDPSALAITTVFAQQSNGLILDSDLELNAVRFKWGDLVAHVGTQDGAEDLQNTLTHELGHVLGLEHNCFFPGNPRRGVDNNGVPVPDCNAAPPEVQASTLFASVMRGDTDRRTLEADDIAGVCAIYPAATMPACGSSGDNSDSGGCSAAGARPGQPADALVVLSIGLGLAVLGARRRSRWIQRRAA